MFGQNNFSLENLVKATVENIESKVASTDKELLKEVDRAGVLHLRQQSIQATDDPYSQWFFDEATQSLKTDPNRVIVISTVISCLAKVAKGDTPKQFKGMSMFQIFYTLYAAVLDFYDENPLVQYSAKPNNPFDEKWRD